MKTTFLVSLATAALSSTAAAVSVSGSAEGFAKGVTGGGSATAVYPDTIDELVSYLGDDEARVIVLSKTFDFTDSEGTTTETGCAPWGTDAACQVAINQNDWCTNYQPDAPSVSVTYDNAGTLGITVNSDKTLIGEGSAGVIKGKGLRLVSGTSNVIIQNIAITDINPKYVWGGDAITLNDVDMVWIDHVTTARIARQHIVLGTEADNRVTISNSFINGESDYSATCDGYHYWGIYLDGSSDMVTMKGNYIYHTSGRSPKVQGNTLLHAVNNYWHDNSDHAFEIGEGAYVLAEGNVFQNIPTVAEDPIEGELFASPSESANEVCSTYLGRVCELNGFGSSGTFNQADTDFLSKFEGKNIASADSYSSVASSVASSAGNTL
uniref:Pectin lyase A n=1 Tax=Emericella nidulans (strain FGSC A4 / ATCC 38163 / CBS 112.46 / NRRL 194 / M139) TaxID=227321 RepID=PELA_EMENI|nr:RecName: Full=Pectin lyase A; Short=PLA; Flags: Precursor [Aspergillus nidulans FGSC A4]ABF50854.1 pectin lyase [Aspergillus nidulans]